VLVTQTGVLSGKTVVAVSAGDSHDLVLCSDGTIAAWGSNSSGQLGNGSTTGSSVPLLVNQSGVLSGKTVVSVSAGRGYSLALCSDGTIAAWGSNSSGQLGNGSTTNSSVPDLVIQSGVLSGKTVVAVSAGGGHCLVRKYLSSTATLSSLLPSSGVLSPVFASSNTNYSSSVTTSSITVRPTVIDTTASIAVNGSPVMSGTDSAPLPLAVGSNIITVLVTAEDGTTTSTYIITVTRLPLVASFISPGTIPITAASYTATGNDVQLSLDFAPPTGTNLTVVKNTGLNFISGQFSNLAHGQVVNLSYGGKSYRFVANYYGGSGNDLVLEWAYRDLAAWGANSNGELGNNSNNTSSVPVVVSQAGVLSGKTVVAVSACSNHSLALCSDGMIAAWGNNGAGQLGNDSTSSSSVPVLVNQSGVLSGKTVVAVSAGDFYSLALCSDGSIAAWGTNGSGQLGNNSTSSSSVPVLVTQSGVLSGKTVVAVSAGRDHSLALCSDGTIAAWGSNSSGQLGNSSTTNSSVPVLVTDSGVLSGKTVVAVSSGDLHSLALCSDGTIAAWGASSRLGNDSTTNSSVPVLVTQSGVLSGKTVVAVSAGSDYSLALCSDGTIAAWGRNSSGQLGNNSTTNSSVPVLVNRSGVLYGKTVVAVSAGTFHSLALCSDGTLAAWGTNGSGQLGNNSTSSSSVPVLVTQSGVLSGKTVVAVSAGGGHSLSLSSYDVSTAGLSNLSLSSGNISPKFDPATSVYSADVLHGVSSMTVQPTALLTNLSVIKINGNVVDSGSNSQSIPLVVGANVITILVTAPDGITTKTYTIAVTRLLPLVASFTSPSIIPVTAASYTATGNDVELSLGFAPPTGTNLTIVKNTGLPFISGQFSNLAHGQVVNLSYGGKSYRFVANYYGGSGNDLVLEWAYSNLAAWGYNSVGQLGNNSIIDSSNPVLVNQSGLLSSKTVVAVSASENHNLALCSDGTIAAWGYNDRGQLGNNSIANSNFPVLVDQSGVLSGKTVVAVSAGGGHSLALCSDGTIAAWGSNGSGQLGNGNTTMSRVPVRVTNSGVLSGKTVVAVSAGDNHSLALCSDGTRVAWGLNYYGQLGNNSTTNSSVPVLVTESGVLSGKTVLAVSAGGGHSLALCSDGTIAAWGYNDRGQLGNDSYINTSVPVRVDRSLFLGKTVVAVSAGGGHSLALCSDGTIAAWGWNYFGQLGNNSTAYSSSVPVLVTQSGLLSGKTVGAVSAGAGHSLVLSKYDERTADLINLSLSHGNINPHFDPNTTVYSLEVAYDVTSITVLPTALVVSVL
jgi:alpha-tubulin suppressor-like RCC1 family protein